MRSLRMSVVAGVTGVTLASGMLAATSAEAMSATITTAAAARDCTSWTSGQTGNVKCTRGSGARIHRAVVTCMSRNGGGAKWEITGPWVILGQTSSATCSATGMVYSISRERSYHG